MNQDLLNLRERVDEIDQKIINLLEERFSLCPNFCNIKKQNGLQIEDKNREKDIIDRKISQSRLDAKFIEELFTLIIRKSKEIQKEYESS